MLIHRTLSLVTLMGLLLPAPKATADTIVLNTSDNRFSPPARNQGWWSSTAQNNEINDNYFTGRSLGKDYRSFFSFDMSAIDLSRQNVVSTRLELSQYFYAGSDAGETIEFFDVSTPAAILNRNTGPNNAIFDDLGSGTSFGSFVVPQYAPFFDPNHSPLSTVSFSLNPAAVASVRAASGGFFSIGGSLSSISGPADQGVFSASVGEGIQRLILETAAPVPEPNSLVLLSIALAGITGQRIRRAHPWSSRPD
jgi:PEP-CTERM motif-containing protein